MAAHISVVLIPAWVLVLGIGYLFSRSARQMKSHHPGLSHPPSMYRRSVTGTFNRSPYGLHRGCSSCLHHQGRPGHCCFVPSKARDSPKQQTRGLPLGFKDQY